MKSNSSELSRISKLFVDKDSLPTKDGLRKRQQFKVMLVCGADVATSYMLQLSLITAAKIAFRCFPDAVCIILSEHTQNAPTLPWPKLKGCPSIGALLRQIVGSRNVRTDQNESQRSNVLLFGDTPEVDNALRVTFDGWIAKTGPASQVARLQERPHCSLAAILAAALGVSELFLRFAQISLEARRRPVALSLWRPDLDQSHADAIGPVVEWLPADLWVLGLGHLGNAYLWALGTLPYNDPNQVRVFLNDFDTVNDENIETSLLFHPAHLNRTKARTCAAWLESRGFQTRLLERRFDETFRCQLGEPQLALCGFDSNSSRRDLGLANFKQIIESGLGGTSDNFDTLSIHVLPNPRDVSELWPDLSPAEDEKRKVQQERVIHENKGYTQSGLDACGRFEFAGKSVAVPFVGTIAGCFVIAEALRLFHDGPAYTDSKLRLETFGLDFTRRENDYCPDDTSAHKYTPAQELRPAITLG